MGYDWLYGYAGFTPAFKNKVADLLVRWSDVSQSTRFTGWTIRQAIMPKEIM